ncbi:MAG: hypothetical protein K1X75_15960 [Leptospirales bacterium]|nr:hypothetical protein [Leptospirales bacterium]
MRFDFEREGLFQLLARSFPIRRALYPGSSVHLTPSFHIPCVDYVDLKQDAARFFEDRPVVLNLIESRKSYRPASDFHFVLQDYIAGPSLPGSDYDLLLSLYAPKVVDSCLPCLRSGGLLLTCNHFGDVAAARMMPELEALAILKCREGRYQYREAESAELEPIIRAGRRNYSTRVIGEGFSFRDEENYVLFRKF